MVRLIFYSTILFCSCNSDSGFYVYRIVDGKTIELTNGSLITLKDVVNNSENIKILEHYAKGHIDLFDSNSNELAAQEVNNASVIAYNSDGDCLNDLLTKANTITLVSPASDDTEQVESEKFVVKMTENSGVYEIPVKVNGELMYFIFDTGASLISISSKEAISLYKSGSLTADDVLGKSEFSDANGDISEGTIINLKTVEIGKKTLDNVVACVVDNQNAPLLFGQSALGKFGKVSIDYTKGEIVFE